MVKRILMERNIQYQVQGGSERITKEPNWFGERVVYLAADGSEDPATLTEASNSPEAGQWRRAMEKELESLRANEEKH